MKPTIEISKDLTGLLDAAEEILHDSPTKGPIIEAISNRITWKQIQDDYEQLREEQMKSCDAFEYLSEKYHYSVKSIQAIIYYR